MSDVSVSLGADSRQMAAELRTADRNFDQTMRGMVNKASQSGDSIGAKLFAGVSSRLTGLGAAVAAAFSIGKAIEKAGEIEQISRRFGDGAENVQKLGAAARAVGADMEIVSKGGFKAFVEAQKAL